MLEKLDLDNLNELSQQQRRFENGVTAVFGGIFVAIGEAAITFGLLAENALPDYGQKLIIGSGATVGLMGVILGAVGLRANKQ